MDLLYINFTLQNGSASIADKSQVWNDTTYGSEETAMSILEQVTTIIMASGLVTLMIGMGAATDLSEVWRNVKHPWGSTIGMVSQFGCLPATGFGLSILLDLPPYQALGLLVLSCSPGGALSNYFTYWVDGDIALSILMTTTSSLLAFGAMPLNLWFYSKYWTDDEMRIPYLSILKSMFLITGPVIIGMFIRYYTKLWASRICKFCLVVVGFCFMFCLTSLLFTYWKTFTNVSINLVIAAACFPFLGFTFAYILAKLFCLNSKVSRTIGIEAGSQNIAVALSLMLLSYQDEKVLEQMVTFPTIYGIFQMLEISVVIFIFQMYKRWSFTFDEKPANEEGDPEKNRFISVNARAQSSTEKICPGKTYDESNPLLKKPALNCGEGASEGDPANQLASQCLNDTAHKCPQNTKASSVTRRFSECGTTEGLGEFLSYLNPFGLDLNNRMSNMTKYNPHERASEDKY